MTTSQSTKRQALAGAASGLLAAASGVLAAEGLSVLLSGVTTPVVAVGNRVIDWTPRPVKEFAIETFGTADKPILIGGVLGAVALLAALAGLIAVRRPRPGVVLFSGLVLLAGVAMLTDRAAGASLWVRLLPVLLMGVVGIGGFLWLSRTVRGAGPAVDTTAVSSEGSAGFDRRAFLLAASAVAAVGAVGGAGSRLATSAATASRDALALPAAGSPAAALPTGVTFDIPGLTPYLTSNADFYRVDNALTLPDVGIEGFRLRIHGMVERELNLSFEDLLDRELVERRITLTCVSNPVGGEYAGNATWLGVPMRELLAEAGVRPGADAVLSTSADNFTAGTPLSVLTDDRDALVAIGMNGEPLPVEHGFPVRMVTPGLYGYVSATKWLVDLEVTRFADFNAYWTDRGYAEQAPIKTSSRIDVPRSFARLDAGEVVVAGVAWSQDRGIDQVEVRVDEGDWTIAELAAEDSTDTWRPWRWTWDAQPGTHRLEVRATDRTGTTQTPRRAPIAPDGATGWHSTTVTVS